MLKIIDKERYEDALSGFEHDDYLLSSLEGDKLSRDGYTVYYLAFIKDDKEVAYLKVCLIHLLKFFKYAYVPGGFIVDYKNKDILKELANELKKFLAKKKVIYLALNPAIEYQKRDLDGNVLYKVNEDIIANMQASGFVLDKLESGTNTKKTPRFVSILNLNNKSKKDVEKAYSTLAKRNIKVAKKWNVKYQKLKRDELSLIERMINLSGERNNFVSKPTSYFEEMYDIFQDKVYAIKAYIDVEDSINKLNEELLHNKKEEEKAAILKRLDFLANCQLKTIDLSCCFFLEYKDHLIYYFGGSDFDYQMTRANYGLHDMMIDYALANGFKKYDFYGISGNFKEDEEGYGLFIYKKGFGAEVKEYVGYFSLICNPILYKIGQLIGKI